MAVPAAALRGGAARGGSTPPLTLTLPLPLPLPLTRELRETVERVENRYSPQLRRQFYSLSNTDAKYRHRALILPFLLHLVRDRLRV